MPFLDHPGLLNEFTFRDTSDTPARAVGEFLVYNASGEDIPANALAEVSGTCNETGGTGRQYLSLVKPTADSLKQVVVCPVCIFAGQTGRATLDFTRGGLIIRYDPAAGAPALGDTVGTQSGSWLAKKGNTGFNVLKIRPEATATDPIGERVFCSLGGGGGGSTIQLVKAQSAGSNGSVSVKNIALKSDTTLSPNYDEVGSAYSVAYIHD